MACRKNLFMYLVVVQCSVAPVRGKEVETGCVQGVLGLQ